MRRPSQIWLGLLLLFSVLQSAVTQVQTRRLLRESDDTVDWSPLANNAAGGGGGSGASQPFSTVTRGSCSDVGLHPLPTISACKTASLALGFHEGKQPSIVSELFKASVPYGCSVFRYPGEGSGTSEGQLVVNPYHDTAAGCGAVGGAFTCLCSSSPSAADIEADGSENPPTDQLGSATYVAVRSGSCDTAGLQAIDTAAECQLAGSRSAFAVNAEPQLLAGSAFQQTVAYGCSIFERPDSKSLLFNEHSSAAECGSLSGFHCLCREASTETPSATPTDLLQREYAQVVVEAPSSAKYEAITSGTCEDAHMEAIETVEECVAATEAGGGHGSASQLLQLVNGTGFEHIIAYGCSIFHGPTQANRVFNGYPSTASCDALDRFSCLCRVKSAETTPQSVAPPQADDFIESSSSAALDRVGGDELSIASSGLYEGEVMADESVSSETTPQSVGKDSTAFTTPESTVEAYAEVGSSSDVDELTPSSTNDSITTTATPAGDRPVDDSSQHEEGRTHNTTDNSVIERAESTVSTTHTPLPPSVSKEFGYCGHQGCRGIVIGDKWCSSTPERCSGGCRGTWCPVSGYCSWDRCSGTAQGSPWCNASQRNCADACGGSWCPSD